MNDIDRSTNNATAQQVFEDNVQRVGLLQKTLNDCVERYKKLVPLLELVQKELDLKVPDKLEPSLKAPQVPPSTQPKNPARKRSYSKKTSNAPTPQQGFTPQMTIQEVGKDGSEGQPILL